MKVAVVLLCLALVATASAQRFGNRRFQRRRPVGGANGFGNAGSTQGQTSGLFGTSQIQNSFANAGGSAFGGGASFNRANSNVGQSTGLFGNRQFANNQATSNQFGG
ncbi:heterogeneous nuclear ribonucleoprotein A1-like [Amphibalanus amphitrite]|uniref:heterogeneous nuclear ribonucleoprotein A1-like n=1 Tax=Amphibalanus amphitrite TaxID=1232801 RepID=UPI001C915BB3|nr:heterogeneous nuclear ribonucleoprotein A1-like [Amphibalanus amphitrite]